MLLPPSTFRYFVVLVLLAATISAVSVRRVPVPVDWAGQTLIDLDFRREFDLTVIGLVDKRGEDGRPQVRLDVAPTIPLGLGDILVVLGSDEKLERLTAAIRELSEKAEQAADAGSV